MTEEITDLRKRERIHWHLRYGIFQSFAVLLIWYIYILFIQNSFANWRKLRCSYTWKWKNNYRTVSFSDFNSSFSILFYILTLPEHLISLPVFSGVRVTRSLVLCVCFVDRCLSFWPLFCLFFFDWRVLIISLASSNSS